MRVQVIQHVPFEGPGNITEWIKRREFSLALTESYKGESLPGVADYDILIVLGGPMGVGDEVLYPWLKEEKEAIKKAIQAGKRVLGICLGAQLIAEALGGSVYKNRYKEIGWHSIRLERTAPRDIWEGIPDNPVVFQWHADTFELPPGCRRIASSKACVNQAFLYESRVLALQFHLESTEKSVSDLCRHCESDLDHGLYVQKKNTIAKRTEEFDLLSRQNDFLLDNFLRISEAGAFASK